MKGNAKDTEKLALYLLYHKKNMKYIRVDMI
jgi:hypothetical protein